MKSRDELIRARTEEIMAQHDHPAIVAAEQPKEVAKLLDALPGLCGAIDAAIKGETGINQPFVLVVFHGSNAVHITNFEPAEAMRMLKAMMTDK